MEIVTIHGSKFDYEPFEPFISKDELMGMLLGPLAKYISSNGVEVERIAALAIEGIHKGLQSFDHRLGASFKTHLKNHIRYAILDAFTSKEGIVEAQVWVPKAKQNNSPVFERIDREDDPLAQNDRLSMHDVLHGESTSPELILDAKAEIARLADSVMVLKGLLRYVPTTKRQQLLDLFEGHYGLRGEKPQSFELLGKRWGIKAKSVRKVMYPVWKKLALINCPIRTPLELRNILAKIQDLQEIIGDPNPFHFTSYTPSTERLREIQCINHAFKRGPKAGSPYSQLELSFDPIIGEDAFETVTLNVCKAFKLDFSDVTAHTRRSTNRVSTARHIITQTLHDHLGCRPIDLQRRGFMPRRMVRHACITIRKELRNSSSPSAAAISCVQRKCLDALRKSGQFEVA